MLRVGVVLDSYMSSAWIAKVIEDVQSSEFAQLKLVVRRRHSAQDNLPPKAKLRHGWRTKFFALYERWDYGRNRANHDGMQEVDVASLFRGVAEISVDASRSGPARLSEAKLAEIHSYDLDVLIDFTGEEASIAGVARYGTWYFQHGEHFESGGCPPLLWELMERRAVSESSLRIFAVTLDGGEVIYRSYSSTDKISLYCGRNPIYWKTAEFAMRRLRDLDRHGIEYIQSLSAGCKRTTGRAEEKRVPSNGQIFSFIGRHVTRWFAARVAALRPGAFTKWYIAIRRSDGTQRFDDSEKYRLMECPRDSFYADPFLFENGGKTFLFFEDFRFAEGRAVISCCELDGSGMPGKPVEVLRCPHHLSYPFVFEHEGEVYMVPETKENRKVELYRATDFPAGWVSEAVLLDNIYAVDATIQQIDGKFWMFAGVSNGMYSNSDELSLFYADALKGPWTPHPNNPVVSDVRRSRPAGKLFYEKGRLIRPSQDCSKVYGYALEFSEIVKLSETEYEERPIARLDPEHVEGCVSTHTYNRTEQFEVVDRTLPVNVAERGERNPR